MAHAIQRRGLMLFATLALSIPILATGAQIAEAQTTWSSWSEVPTGGATSSGPGVVVCGGLLNQFVRGTDSRIYRIQLTQ
jgi:hypothetical protein